VDVDAYMAERRPMIEAGIEACFRPAPGVPDRPAELEGAMRHLLFPGGKRLRPLFAVAAAEAVAGAAEAALPIAVAVELVHTYSLIHDDLPCMDDDTMRRGRPTVHVAYDEATAVLAGDALLTEAFAVLTASSTGRAAEAVIGVVHRLATAAGASGLVGGQADDLRFAAESGGSDRDADRARLASIHARKTAALFQAAIVGGAALAGGKPVELDALDRFARDVGIAFQIADDLLDADREEAASILRIQGIEDARRGSEALIDRALVELAGFCERAEPLRELARHAVRRSR